MRKVRIQVFCSYPVCLPLHRYKWLNIIMSIKITNSRDLYIMVVWYSWYKMPLKQRVPWNYFFFLINEIQLCLLTKKVKVKSLSRVQLFATPWTVARQALLSMGFSRQENWSGLPYPSPGDLPNPGIEPRSPTLQTNALPSESQGKPVSINKVHSINISYKYMRKVHIKIPVHNCCHLTPSPCQLPRGWWPPKTLKRQSIYTAVLIHLIPESLPQSI